MAVMTDDTFDALRRYVGVRLQQGVPIADSDWNEIDDVHEFGLRAPARWFVGDGVPEGTNGFRIEGTGLTNDFFIRAGVTGTVNGLSNIGRYLTDGLNVTISSDVRFTGQPLHVGQPGSLVLSQALGVPQIQAMPAPAPNGTVTVYLDSWERLVTAKEDPSLVQPGLGTESCARLRRESVVRVRSGAAIPSRGDQDSLPGHSYVPLASIAWSDAVVDAADVTDLRERRLLLPPATLPIDLFGTTPAEYRRGRGRPVLSLREAINALLRGSVPGTSETPLTTPSLGLDVPTRAIFHDPANGLVAFWAATRLGNANPQTFVTRLDLNRPEAGFSNPVQITNIISGGPQTDPHAALLPTGEIVLVNQAANFIVHLRRATFANIANTAAFSLNGAGETCNKPFVVVSGDIIVVFYFLSGNVNRWAYRRRRISDNAMLDAASVTVSSQTTDVDFHAARDAAGVVWAFYRVSTGGIVDVRTIRLTPTTGTLIAEEVHEVVQAGALGTPFVLPLAGGDVWLFWGALNGLHTRRFRNGAFEPVQSIPGTVAADRQPCAVEDADGGIWLYWAKGSTAVDDIMVARRDPVSGAWSAARQLTGDPNDDSAPFALIGPDRAHWLFWSATRQSGLGGALDTDVYFRRLFPSI
jgi:hypothetical protein